MDDTAAIHENLTDEFWPALFQAADWLLTNSRPDGQLAIVPDKFTERNWYDFSALALVYTTDWPGNPFYHDQRLADLIRRAGAFLANDYGPNGTVDFAGYWWDDRPDEWTVESWLLAYELLQRGGAGELTVGWKESFIRVAQTYDRYCQNAENIRRMISPNLKISTNHFAYFAAVLLRIGQVFGDDRFVQRGLEMALRINGGQHPDGYWAESHGPTTSYNLITMAAIGLCYRYTGRPEFAESLRRAVDFHTRFSYPDGVCLETIDQRVRYPSCSVFALHAFSDWPDGRGWARLCWQYVKDKMMTPDGQAIFGRLANDIVYWRAGPEQTAICAGPDYQARLSDLPGGIVKRDGWAVGLCGIPSRSRNHLFTFDRQNLLSIWHRDCGLIIGGGNNRDNPQSATFYARVPNDPTAIVHGIAHEDVCVPAEAAMMLDAAGGELDLGYAGYDARLAVRAADERTCRITAWTGTLPVNEPVTLNLNILTVNDQPLQSGAGPVALGDSDVDLSGDRLGGWVGQGRWRISVPPDARLSYPMVPFRCNPSTQSVNRLAVLTVPVANRQVELVVTIC